MGNPTRRGVGNSRKVSIMSQPAEYIADPVINYTIEFLGTNKNVFVFCERML